MTTNTDGAALLPCPNPWCMGDVHSFCNGAVKSSNYVRCKKCGIKGPTRSTRAEAITAWNTRAPLSATQEDAERAGGNEDALERWHDIRDNPDAIVACGDRWKAAAAKIGCKLHGFNDGYAASFITPDGHVIEIGPKFRKAISASPPTQRQEYDGEALREAARALVAKLDECDPHIADAFLMREMKCGPYDGPNYSAELRDLRAALAHPAQAPAQEGDMECVMRSAAFTGSRKVYDIEQTVDETGRLREALEKIATCESYHPSDVVAIARAALRPQGQPKGEG